MTQLQKILKTQLTDKKIVVLGLGLTGLSFVRFLHANGFSFSVNDSRHAAVNVTEFMKIYPGVDLILGQWNPELIASAEVLLVSPGIDIGSGEIANAINEHCQIMGDIELYCRLSTVPILAVTGSNGKSTVVSMLHYLGEALGHKVQLAGNIGTPVLEGLQSNSAKVDWLILELSSFQLETLHSMNATAATLLNISDDHLDRHLTLENYTSIKQRIYQQCQIAVFNRDDQASHVVEQNSQRKLISFGSDRPNKNDFGMGLEDGKFTLLFGEEPLIAVSDLPIAGMHNALNCLAALALGYSAGWSLPKMVNKLTGFCGLPHRCERVESQDGILWINDSKATNVGAALAAIHGLAATLSENNKLILIAGGEGKGADFSPLKNAIDQHVTQVFTLGKDGDKIAQLTDHSRRVQSIEQAVTAARQLANKGDIILLSPACASIDMFKNFAERGQVFIKAVQAVQAVSEDF